MYFLSIILSIFLLSTRSIKCVLSASDCKYFSTDGIYYLATDYCFASRTNNVYKSYMYECQEDGSLFLLEYNNTDDADCSGERIFTYNESDPSAPQTTHTINTFIGQTLILPNEQEYIIYCDGSDICGTRLREYSLGIHQQEAGITTCEAINTDSADFIEYPISTEVCVDYGGYSYQWGCHNSNKNVFYNFYSDNDNCNGQDYVVYQYNECDPDSDNFGDKKFEKAGCTGDAISINNILSFKYLIINIIGLISIIIWIM